MNQILCLDISGRPFRWLDDDRAAYYVAGGKVAWALGEEHRVFHGGCNRITGARSILRLPSIIALAKSEAMVRHHGDSLPLGHDNALLFRRDRDTCAYCGQQFDRRWLTRDHIVPRGQGGKDVWANVVAACRPCNMRKACRTPEQAHMPLIVVPYVPCRFEHFILTGRRILADQHEYLAARISRAGIDRDKLLKGRGYDRNPLSIES